VAEAIYQQINGTATGTAIILDNAQTPFNVSFAVELQSGTATFGVQFTLDNPNAAIDLGFPGYLGTAVNTTVTWLSDANVGPGTTTSSVGNYMFPVRAVRCVVASASATALLQFVVLQGYPPSG